MRQNKKSKSHKNSKSYILKKILNKLKKMEKRCEESGYSNDENLYLGREIAYEIKKEYLSHPPFVYKKSIFGPFFK